MKKSNLGIGVIAGGVLAGVMGATMHSKRKLKKELAQMKRDNLKHRAMCMVHANKGKECECEYDKDFNIFENMDEFLESDTPVYVFSILMNNLDMFEGTSYRFVKWVPEVQCISICDNILEASLIKVDTSKSEITIE